MRCLFLTIITILLVGCASAPTVKSLATQYDVLRGNLAAEPSLETGNERLFIYLKVESEVEGEPPTILVCLAHNEEKKRILAETKENLIKAINEPVFIYGNKQNGSFEEIVVGVDYYVTAVGYYMPSAKKYRIVQVGYGQSLRDAISDVSWGDFVKAITKAATKQIK